jgi:hypothetical protein
MAIINGTFLPDILIGTGDDDTINGFGGLDTISGGDGHDTIDGGNGDDVLTGGNGNDILIGGPGVATLLSAYDGGTGNDLMIASDLGIAEDFDGGDDIDTVSFAARDSGVTVFLSVIGIPLLDTITNTENVIGSAFDDEITGDSGANEVTGGEGDDVLDGLGGNDTAVFTGNRSDYVASHGSGSAIIITDQRSGTTDGEDTTSAFEFFKFADRTYTAAELFAPTLTGVAASTTLAENTINATAAVLDSSVTVSTVESLTGGTLAVSGLLSQDIVSVENIGNGMGQIGFADGDVSYGGVVIGTATGGSGATLTITFNASATDAAVQELVEHLTYQTTSDQPTASRDLTITLTDGAAGSASGTITVNVTAQNDAPSITSNGGSSTATVTPQENTTAVTTVTASDPDLNPTLTYSIVGGDDQTLFEIDASTGVLSFKDAPSYENPTDSDTDNSYIVDVRVSDGLLTADQTITVNVTDANEGPSITSNGGSSTATVAIQENDTAVTTVVATDPDASTTFVYSIVGGADQARFQIDASTGALSFIAAPDYEAPTDGGTDNGYVVQVQASDGSLSATQTITVNVTDENELQVGTPGDDVFIATTGAYRIDALGGVDTVTFNFALTDATFEWDGNTVIISAAGSEITVTGMEVFAFTDGTVNNADGNVLVDDLFYYANNHDVWLAQVDADSHYSEMGWKEDRDPNAFFDVSVYLALNPAVKAAGIDPLADYAQSGWMEGRIPSLDFDLQQYLVDNPDVAAANIDPLQHFLLVGAGEGRQPTAVARLVNADGFDAAYYLRHNADVADAGIDPYEHFQQIGWREGRNPNAFFDTAGYLAHNPDVAAADLNPLYHYNTWGWHEGRDPSSTGFDTAAYLAANSDVVDAHVNPLLHFLQSGIAEGRLPLGDGLWS